MRSIISSHEFDRQVEALGGAKALDEVFLPLVDVLTVNPYSFPLFENDFTSFRYALTKENAVTPALAIIFTIDENKNVVLEWIEILS